jgi:DNA replication protein DnaC
MLNDISKRLNELRLYGITETLDTRLESAYKSKLTYEELLLCIFDDQYEYQDNKVLSRRINTAKFEEYKSFDGYETMGFSIEVNSIINELKTGKFLNAKNHVIIMGPVVTGKTHLSYALRLLVYQQGKKVCFIRSNDLTNKLYQAKADDSWLKAFNYYSKFDVLILDDFGLKSLSAEQSTDLYDLIASIHIKSSLIITTNRNIQGMLEVFHDPVMANAAMDRILSKSYKIILEGESYRKRFTPTIYKTLI